MKQMSPGKHSDWPILGHYSPVMPTGRQQASTPKQKGHIINNSLTSKVQLFMRKSQTSSLPY